MKRNKNILYQNSFRYKYDNTKICGYYGNGEILLVFHKLHDNIIDDEAKRLPHFSRDFFGKTFTEIILRLSIKGFESILHSHAEFIKAFGFDNYKELATKNK
jgi:hypothetical protein